MEWNKVSLIGLGLLGGSLGKALIEGKHARKIAGYVRRPERIQQALNAGVVHEASGNLRDIVKEADLIVLCTPVLSMLPIVESMVPFLKNASIVTDVGSVKAPLVAQLEPIIHQAKGVYVGSHPMAGSEQQGLQHADASLFSGATCVLTPGTKPTEDAVEKVKQLWKQVQGIPIVMHALEHDMLVARSSHLPHAMAALLAEWVLDPSHGKLQAQLCSSGFKDTTRVASGSPEMWSDILLSNKDAVVQSLESHEDQCRQLRHWIQSENQEALLNWLKESKHRRDSWLKEYEARRPSRSVE